MGKHEVPIKGEGKYEIAVDLNIFTTSIYYISHTLDVDIKILIMLYEKYGRDLWYFFYLFSGRKISFFSENRMKNIFRFSHIALEALHNGVEEAKLSKRDLKVLDKLKGAIDVKSKQLFIDCKLGKTYERSSEQPDKEATGKTLQHCS